MTGFAELLAVVLYDVQVREGLPEGDATGEEQRRLEQLERLGGRGLEVGTADRRRRLWAVMRPWGERWRWVVHATTTRPGRQSFSDDSESE